jgi:hypothetical protein
MWRITIALVVVGATGCPAGGAAYGPSGDERLEEAADEAVGSGTSSGGSIEEAVRAIEANDCPKIAKALEKVASETDEEAKVADLTGIVGRLDSAKKVIDERSKATPEVVYFSGKTSDGVRHDIPDTIQTCEAARITARGELDRLIREVLKLPIVEEVSRKRRGRMITKARVDFDLLGNAIAVLHPADQAELQEKLDKARARLKAATHKKRRRRRR